MSLHFHRSKNIPNIDFSGDGKLFVTDGEGTFPMRSDEKKRSRLKDAEFRRTPQRGAGEDNYGYAKEEDFIENGSIKSSEDYRPSYRSYDPVRDQDRWRYRKKEPSRFAAEIDRTTQISTVTSEKRRRFLQRKQMQKWDESRWTGTLTESARGDTINRRYNSLRSNGTAVGRKVYASSVTEGHTNTLTRHGAVPSLQKTMNRTRTLNMAELKQARKVKNKEEFRRILLDLGVDPHKSSGWKLPLLSQDAKQERRISDERLPCVAFLVIGCLMVMLGVVKILLSWWHNYYCVLWTGLVVLAFGISGATHKKRYLDHTRNVVYIGLGLLVTMASIATSTLLLWTIVPLSLALDSRDNATAAEVAPDVDFTFVDSPAVEPDDASAVVWASLIMDCVSLLLAIASSRAATATMMAVCNHWDARYTTHGKCDHRGHPLLFNPIDQLSLCFITILVGVVAVRLSLSEEEHYWLPLWSGLFMAAASVLAFIAYRRTDSAMALCLGAGFQICALVSIGAGAVVVLLRASDDWDDISDAEGALKRQLIAALVFAGFYAICVVVNVVFTCGVVFRLSRKLCCWRCFEKEENTAEA